MTYIKDIIGYSGSVYKSDTGLLHADCMSLFTCCQPKLFSERFVIREQEEILLERFFTLYFEVLANTGADQERGKEKNTESYKGL